MIKVYQANARAFSLILEAGLLTENKKILIEDLATLFAENYVLVAEVATDSLDVAYEQTQNLTENGWWNDNAHTLNALKTNVRSSSCGDILVDTKNPLVGKVVSAFGFFDINLTA